MQFLHIFIKEKKIHVFIYKNLICVHVHWLSFNGRFLRVFPAPLVVSDESAASAQSAAHLQEGQVSTTASLLLMRIC